MELVQVACTLAELPSRQVEVSHVRAGLTRGLELDQQVVVRCADDEFVAATVISIDFDLRDTRYVLELGVRLPVESAAIRLGLEPADPVDEHRAVTVDDVLELMGRLRRARGKGDG